MDNELKKFVEEPFVIYGAQVVAYGAYRAIWSLFEAKPVCFAVSSITGNPTEIEGIRVKELDEVDREVPILICVSELLQMEMADILIKKGFTKFIKLTQDLEYNLMKAYFTKEERFYEAEAVGSPYVDFQLYEVRNHNDKKLFFHPELKKFERSLQAGADLTQLRIAEFADNTGTNISWKNKQYCEMTGTYWAWKNTNCEWVGIEHYRRHLLVVPEMLTNEVDAILPFPYMCYPNTIAQFGRFVSKNVIQCVLKALRDLHPDVYAEYQRILYGEVQYTYNLVIAKKEVFNLYCSWFFEITEYIENMSDQVPEIKETRALSYVAEVLTNLFFMHNQYNFNIRHANKKIYV